ncbi:MAG: hypothetical protein M1818_006564 [Claussenomyces sp. TS43310]|nr:MAG: hypothetical protein M1818_006564 [Claussenomyces sp. TS43310]
MLSTVNPPSRLLTQTLESSGSNGHAKESEGRLVVVLGAGVNGLHAAVSLLEAGYAVSVIGKYLPGDLDPKYPSEIAASQWASDLKKTDATEREWYKDAYDLWIELSHPKHDQINGAGISRRTYYQYQDKPGPEALEKGAEAYWYRDIVKDFKVIPADQLPNGIKWGTSFTSFAIDAPKYLQYLQNRVLALGGTIQRATLPTGVGIATVLSTANDILKVGAGNVFAYVNATGLGAKDVFGDKNVFPMRSQIVHIKGECENLVDRLEEGNMISDADDSGLVPITYVTPRVGSGFTVLGGHMHEGNWNEEVDPAVSRKLLELGKWLAPELLNEKGELEVVSEHVGLRPHRTGGVRVEVEKVKGLGDKEEVAVIHDYGHSHGGWIKSVGSAKKVLSLVNGLAPQSVMESIKESIVSSVS